MPDPLVSIVLPTHNRADLLPGAIESVLSQTYANWELIVVADYCSDNTIDVVRSFEQRDRRIRGIVGTRMKKLPGALNEGFEHSKGDLLTWTSDDNYYRPNALERMVQALEEHPEAGMVCTDYTEIDDNGNELKRVFITKLERLVNEPAIGACFMYRRSVYNAVGEYAEDLFLAEDFEYWIRIQKQFDVVALNEDLYLYRVHERSLTSEFKKQAHLTAFRTIERHIDTIPWLNPKVKVDLKMTLASVAYWEGDIVRLRKHLPYVLFRDPVRVLSNFKSGVAAMILGEGYLKRTIAGRTPPSI